MGSADLAELLLERGAAERAAQRAAHADQERRRREFAQAHPDATVAGNAPAAAVADGPGDMDGASGIPPETGVAAEHDPRQEADVEVPPPLVATADRQGHTALHMAARAGQAEALRAMLRGVAGSDGRDPREGEPRDGGGRSGMLAELPLVEAGECLLWWCDGIRMRCAFQFPSNPDHRCPRLPQLPRPSSAGASRRGCPRCTGPLRRGASPAARPSWPSRPPS